jgi:DNA polymerase-3 subunit epsilon|tara:strand:+ start:578 stop:1945 length:1368 start_codon:yes stop_codon:yes gene_type:complete
MFAVIDIEATGGKVGEERIIEIAIFLFNGKKIVDQFISLVQVDCEIPKFVQKLTGIKPSDLVNAPKFHEIAKRIIQITEDSVFVAHNASFDYRILRQEFYNLGYDFSRPVIDTIPLAEKFLPNLPAYGLATICKELEIINSKRHRADGDARATVKLLEILLEKDREKYIEGVYLKQPSVTGKHAFSKLIENLVKTIGVYYLFNSKGEVIYVGKSDQLRVRIDRHFLSTNEKAIALQKEVENIRIEETGSLLMAEILEHIELMSLKPKYNTPKDKFSLKLGLFTIPSEQQPLWDIRKIRHDKPLLLVESLKEGYRWLAEISKSLKMPVEKIVLPSHINGVKKELKKLKNDFGINLVNQSQKLERPVQAHAILQKLTYPENQMILIDAGNKIGTNTLYLIENYEFIGYSSVALVTDQTNWHLLKKKSTRVDKSVYLNSLIIKSLKDYKIKPIEFTTA